MTNVNKEYPVPSPTPRFKEAKITEAQQQWWNIKAGNFDSVMLFKVGKFYEVRGIKQLPKLSVSCTQYSSNSEGHVPYELRYGVVGTYHPCALPCWARPS